MKVRLFFVALGFLLLAERFGFIATALVIAATVTMLLSRSRATPIPDDFRDDCWQGRSNATFIGVSVIDVGDPKLVADLKEASASIQQDRLSDRDQIGFPWITTR